VLVLVLVLGVAFSAAGSGPSRRAIPRSPIFAVPSASISRLPGLMSRWTILCRSAYSSPRAASAAS
jgi:hypothetical protein